MQDISCSLNLPYHREFNLLVVVFSQCLKLHLSEISEVGIGLKSLCLSKRYPKAHHTDSVAKHSLNHPAASVHWIKHLNFSKKRYLEPKHSFCVKSTKCDRSKWYLISRLIAYLYLLFIINAVVFIVFVVVVVAAVAIT